MSYEIVKSIRLEQNENGSWYAVVTSACNNVRPHDYYKWDYCKNKNLNKEDLQKNILLDFYYGNFHGGKNTKYGKFMTFLGSEWGAFNKNSRACNTYHFYDKLKTNLRKSYRNADGHIVGEDREICYNRLSELSIRQDRELKKQLYKEFLEFKPNCKPTVVRLWRNNTHVGFILSRYKQRVGFYITDSYNCATKYTNTVKLNYVKNLAEKINYKVELIEV